jgi:hypothetical protein
MLRDNEFCHEVSSFPYVRGNTVRLLSKTYIRWSDKVMITVFTFLLGCKAVPVGHHYKKLLLKKRTVFRYNHLTHFLSHTILIADEGIQDIIK